jgi:predicted nucleic acid-binding protein
MLCVMRSLSRWSDFLNRKGKDSTPNPVALARSLDLPIWSNDRDFQSVKADCYSTARLLRALSAQRK